MRRSFILAIALVFLVMAISADNATAKPFYEGKILTLMVGTKPGGGFDTYARLIAVYMKKHLPGSEIIVKNVPGAGHVLCVNQLYKKKPDGLTFALFSRSLIATQVAEVKGVKFDLGKLSWLGSCASGIRSLMVGKNTPYKTLDDLVKGDRVRFAAQGVGSMDYMDPLLVAKMLGAKNWVISTGYGGGEGEMAIIRGELDAAFMTWGSSGKKFLEEARALMFNNDQPVEGYEQIPILPNIAPKEYAGLVDLMLFMVRFNRPVAGPPGIPADRLKILQDAFKQACQDPELLEQAKKIDVPILFIGAEEGEKLVKNALNQPPEIVKLLKESYGVQN
ncbi:MAG: tripartite tricarboxylate transporter substrate-binding protein [Desulfobacterales bacterium]|nr:tripartite tricarboxylate transporter substrate-binding protein [Desulfobacterales bacterium]